MSDYAEFIAGTDPTNPASRFYFSGETVQSNLVQMQWTVVTNRLYQVSVSTDLQVWQPATGWLQASNAPTMSYTDTNTGAVRGSTVFKYYLEWMAPDGTQLRLSRLNVECCRRGMSVKVKICGITNSPTRRPPSKRARTRSGFNFYENSPRVKFRLKIAMEISRQLPPFVLRVGVFVNAAGSICFARHRRSRLTMLQFHGDEPPEFCTQFGLMSMKAFRIRDARIVGRNSRITRPTLICSTRFRQSGAAARAKNSTGIWRSRRKNSASRFFSRAVDAGKCRAKP